MVVVATQFADRIEFNHTIHAPVTYMTRSRREGLLWRPATKRYTLGVPGIVGSQEYISHVSTPNDRYIRNFRLRPISSGRNSRPSDAHSIPDSSYTEIARLGRLSDIIVYVRRLEESKEVGFAADFEVREIPPGSLGKITALSGITEILTLFIAIVQHGLFSHKLDGGGGAATDLPALILALPAAIASWLGYSPSEIARISMSLASRIGRWAVGVLSCMSVLLYVAQIAGFFDKSTTLSSHIMIIDRPLNAYWLILVVTAVVTFSYLLLAIASEFRRYRRTYRSEME